MSGGAARVLIVNADDFGQSAGVNRGVVEAHRNGIVTSASLMVRWPMAADAVALARGCPDLALGLHLDLGEWFVKDGDWLPHYEVVRRDHRDAVEREVERQLAAFRALVGRDPTHIDSHQHVHWREPVRSIVRAKAQALLVPLRGCDERIAYCGAFYGQDEHGTPQHENITAEALVALIARLPPGTTELCCHPAAAQDLDTMYSAEREQELNALCDPRVRAALGQYRVELRSFGEYRIAR